MKTLLKIEERFCFISIKEKPLLLFMLQNLALPEISNYLFYFL